MRQLLVASKDEQLAEAHKLLRAKEAEAAELTRRVDKLVEQVYRGSGWLAVARVHAVCVGGVWAGCGLESA